MISKTEPAGFKKKFDVVSAFIEHNREILLLHRQDHKPQGGKWGVVAGKADIGEELAEALAREAREEIGLDLFPTEARYFDSFFVRYPEYDFSYHMFHVPLSRRPAVTLNREEHKDYRWLPPEEALKLDLIEDEEACIRAFYRI